MRQEPTLREALAFQQAGCVALGSPLYGRILTAVVEDFDRRGISYDLLAHRRERPQSDALALRLLGAVHDLVLAGAAPTLARFYPSVGGTDDGDPGPTFLATLDEHRDAVVAGLGRGVQTNEVGRAAALAPGFVLIARRTGLPLRQIEVGASSGLLLRWDRYWYDTGVSQLGDRDSAVRFDPNWWHAPLPDLTGFTHVAERAGADINPIDPSTTDGRRTLLSFVWPDQRDRLERLTAALDVAANHPVEVEHADAGDFVARRLAEVRRGVVTVVHHSIVLQYLDATSTKRLREAVIDAGRAATSDAPLAWLRMEPAGGHADVRLTMWPGGDDEVLATSGYHGRDVRWQVS